MTFLSTGVAVAFLALLAWIAVHDVMNLKISNRHVLIALGFGLAWFALNPDQIGWGVPIMAVAMFALGFALWMIGWFGGGDAKFMAVLGLMMGTTQVGVSLLTLSAASIAVLIAFGMVRTLSLMQVPLPTVALKYAVERRVPFGVPLAAATGAAIITRAFIPYY